MSNSMIVFESVWWWQTGECLWVCGVLLAEMPEECISTAWASDYPVAICSKTPPWLCCWSKCDWFGCWVCVCVWGRVSNNQEVLACFACLSLCSVTSQASLLLGREEGISWYCTLLLSYSLSVCLTDRLFPLSACSLQLSVCFCPFFFCCFLSFPFPALSFFIFPCFSFFSLSSLFSFVFMPSFFLSLFLFYLLPFSFFISFAFFYFIFLFLSQSLTHSLFFFFFF